MYSKKKQHQKVFYMQESGNRKEIESRSHSKISTISLYILTYNVLQALRLQLLVSTTAL